MFVERYKKFVVECNFYLYLHVVDYVKKSFLFLFINQQTEYKSIAPSKNKCVGMYSYQYFHSLKSPIHNLFHILKSPIHNLFLKKLTRALDIWWSYVANDKKTWLNIDRSGDDRGNGTVFYGALVWRWLSLHGGGEGCLLTH